MIQFIPSKKLLLEQIKKPWITNELKKYIRKRNNLWKRYKRTCNINHCNSFKRVRNHVTSLNRR